MNFNEILESITLQDIIYFFIGVITIISVAVEKIKKLPFNPWSNLLEWAGKRLMSDLNQRLKEIEEQQEANIDAVNILEKKMERKFEESEKRQVDNFKAVSNLEHYMEEKLEETEKHMEEKIEESEKLMEEKFEESERNADEKEAKRLRQSIIEFADACRCGIHHTQNHFENVMRDYSDYVKYCDAHKIPNHFIDSEYTYINELYQECLKENKFL